MRDAGLLAALHALRTPGIGARGLAYVRHRWGSVDALCAASETDLTPYDKRLRTMLRKPPEAAHTWLSRWRCKAAISHLFAEDYPEALLHLDDPPPLLFVRGTPLAALPQPRVIMVGTRRPTAYGRETARRLAAELAEAGLSIGSGLARGIDGAAHEGALDAGGSTFAVLGTPIDRCYPAEHAPLARRILARDGTIVSELPPGWATKPAFFAKRNRLLAALADVVIVVEGTIRSGAMITARAALQLGVEVMAVPGRINDAQAEGPLSLIRDGAAPVCDADSVLQALGQPPAGASTPAAVPTADIPEAARVILTALPAGGFRHIDELAHALDQPVAALLPRLLELELAGLVQAQPGKYYGRTTVRTNEYT